MKNPRDVKIARGAEYFTTLVSVSLLLFIIGAMALLYVAADNETRTIKEKLELSMVMTDSTDNATAAKVLDVVKKEPYVNTARLITREEALENWTKTTGENLSEIFGTNPLSPEIAVTLKAAYSSKTQINNIASKLGKMSNVEGVAIPDSDMIEGMNANISRISLILGILALALVVISFVLINNTVHLSIYSRRFSIHTMQLVGATNNFIRRPLLIANAIVGLISGILSSGVLALVIYFCITDGVIEIGKTLLWEEAGMIFASITMAGILICLLSAWISATRYLRKEYSALFK